MPFKLMAALSGILFGLGLSVSQMINPDKVIAFLDVTGSWDPSLALVLFAAVSVSVFSYRLSDRMEKPWFADVFGIPSRTDLDVRLIAGAATFGIGWGLAGYCPGPVLAALPTGSAQPILFIGAMIVGALSVGFFDRKMR